MPSEAYVAERVRRAICSECHRNYCYRMQGDLVQEGWLLYMRLLCSNCEHQQVWRCVTELESPNRRGT